MSTTADLYTADDLWHMPGEKLWELWDGTLRKVGYAGAEASHIAGTVALLVWEVLGDGYSITGPDGGYVLSRNPDTVLLPDVAVVRRERWPGGQVPDWYGELAPDLVVEIESPTYLPPDLGHKRTLYARAGVSLLWWVDPATRTVTVHRPGHPPVVLTETDTLDGADILPGLTLPITDLFA